ncbi:MAG: CoA transferase [Acetobacteraceae bacterium]|nr:CoA transferase [Acetobacteraceae bacterium]
MLSARPLTGVMVVEIGHSVAAPYAGLILAELGADVVKVENPKGGDYARGWGPPFWGESAAAFHALNRSKRGITVDLADDAERARLRRFIVGKADVLLHNVKAGAMDRLGMGPAGLLAEKPSLLFCNIGAFGNRGPLKDMPGYDPLMQAFGGLMSMLGEDGRDPVRVSVSIMDMATGMWAAIGILAAIAERARTGQGGVIDTSLYETSCGWMTVPLAAYLCSGQMPVRAGSGVREIVPYQVFSGSDGYMMVAAGNDNLFRKLCGVIGRPELADDPRFALNADRVVNRDAIIGALSERLRVQPVAVWMAMLEAAGIPCGPIQTVDQVVVHPQTAAMGIIQAGPEGVVRTVGLPVSFDGARAEFAREAPRLGEHNAEILGG